jgi:hypothetical protein
MWRDRRKAHAKEKEKETAQETTRPAAEATVPSTSACGVAEVVNRVPDARFNLSTGASLGLFRGVAGLTPVLQIKGGRAGVDVKHCFPRSTIQLSTQPPDRSKVQTLAPSYGVGGSPSYITETLSRSSTSLPRQRHACPTCSVAPASQWCTLRKVTLRRNESTSTFSSSRIKSNSCV